jgi:hypothetical protein
MTAVKFLVITFPKIPALINNFIFSPILFFKKSSFLVGQIPLGCSEKDLEGFMSKAGPVEEFKLLPQTKRHLSASGFCTYKDPASAQIALEICLISSII